jgi:hypothetical protein
LGALRGDTLRRLFKGVDLNAIEQCEAGDCLGVRG